MRQFLILIALLFQAFPMYAWQNKVAIITGASRGVGLVTTELLVSKKFTVYGTIRPSNKTSLPVDLIDEASILSFIQTVLEKEGRIDILINNAGYALVAPVESLTGKEIQDQMEVNFFAPI